MKTRPVIIEYLGNPLRFYTVEGKSVCEICGAGEATVFQKPADARALAIIHRFAFEDYCMKPVGQEKD